MKAKLTIMLVVLVAAMLPAVAAAHTIGYGYGYGYSNNHYTHYFWEKNPKPSVAIQKGPNFNSAKSVGAIDWKSGAKWHYSYKPCPKDGYNAGGIDLEGIVNQSTTMMNVLDINVTNTGYKTIQKVILTVGVIGDFPKGSEYVVSDKILSFNDTSLNWMPFGSGSFKSITFMFHLNPGETSTFYVGFYLPPSAGYSNSMGNLWYSVNTH